MIDFGIRLFLVAAVLYIGAHVAISMETPQLTLVAGAIVVMVAGATWALTTPSKP